MVVYYILALTIGVIAAAAFPFYLLHKERQSHEGTARKLQRTESRARRYMSRWRSSVTAYNLETYAVSHMVQTDYGVHTKFIKNSISRHVSPKMQQLMDWESVEYNHGTLDTPQVYIKGKMKVAAPRQRTSLDSVLREVIRKHGAK